MIIKDSENVKVKDGGVAGGSSGGGGGGTIRIGATGKVSALMMQELESTIKTSSKKIKKPAIQSQRIQATPVWIDCGGSSKRRERMMSLSGDTRHEMTLPRKKEQIPMLDSEDLWMDKTPVRGEQRKKVTRRIVETVDLKCGKNDGDWSIIPIGNQLRRLSFSKISD